jgi:hypothetical protein
LSTIADAIHYFKLALNTVDGATIPIPSIANNTERLDEGSKLRSDAAIFEMKIKAQLSLAYCYKEIE